MCRDLLEDEEHLWAFLRVREVEPTINAAERASRHAVLWRKVCGGTASKWGSRFVERVLSVVATCRQRGVNVRGDLSRFPPWVRAASNLGWLTAGYGVRHVPLMLIRG